ncbi:MAG: RluA family pseudouridine synthase [Oscillospiraceae bacterium]|nr:RluA family pseudouridine synthase [Oscillospiraceae bacterium]
MGMKYEFKTALADEGARLSGFLRKKAGLSLAHLRSLKHIEGAIKVDGLPAHTNLILRAGQTVSLECPEKLIALIPCFLEVPVLYESAEVIVYDKPAGMAVHPTLNHPEGTLANVYAAREHIMGKAGPFRPINRLDKNTSGAVLAAKSRLAAPLLAKTAKKLYLTLAEGELSGEFVIEAPIGREEGSIIRRCVSEGGKPSATRVRALASCGSHSLIEAETLTGRTHQIRVHLAHIGRPLAGDTLYGGSSALIGRQALHCARIEFGEPFKGGKLTLIRSALPEDMLSALRKLGLEEALIRGE